MCERPKDISNQMQRVINDEAKDLTLFCRACLQKHDQMEFLSGNLDATNLILQKLMNLLNLEITLAENTPMYLCKGCEELINVSFAFKEQCMKSHNFIENWISLKDSETILFEEVDEKVVIDESDLTSDLANNLKEHQCSSCNTTFKSFKNLHSEAGFLFCHLCKFQKLGLGLDSERDETNDEEDPLKIAYQDSKVEDPGIKGPQKLRLKQYSIEEVNNAISEVKKKYYQNVTCKLCKFTASGNRNLSLHVGRAHSEIKSNWCFGCNETFPDLEQHHNEVHFEDFKCPFCGKNKSCMGKFVEHMVYHTDSRVFHCSICGNSYNFLRHLKRHQLVQHNMPKKIVTAQEPSKEPNKIKHLCPHCGKQFNANHKLLVHIRYHTGEAPYECDICQKKFKVRAHFISHHRIHTGEKPHKCIYCDKSFAQSSTLKTHLMIHTGKKIKCTICQKTFCRAAQLKLHMREHTGEKPYVCETCGQTFKQTSHLVEHSKRHSDERPFECSYCGKGFKNQNTMKVHEQIHTGDKPFQCSQCSYACRQAYSLTQHMKQHENDSPQGHNPHVCHVCQRSYATLAHLFTHIRRYHPNVLESLPEQSSLNPDEPTAEVDIKSGSKEDAYIPVKIKVLENVKLGSEDMMEEPVLEFTVLE